MPTSCNWEVDKRCKCTKSESRDDTSYSLECKSNANCQSEKCVMVSLDGEGKRTEKPTNIPCTHY